MKKKNLFKIIFVCFLVLLESLNAQVEKEKTPTQGVPIQVTKDDYLRVDSLHKRKLKVYNGAVTPNWIEESNYFWYKNHEKQGDRVYIVDASKGKKSLAIELTDIYKTFSAKYSDFKKAKLKIKGIKIDNRRREAILSYKGDIWSYSVRNKKLTEEGLEVNEKQDDDKETESELISPDKSMEAFIQDNNLWIRNLKTNKKQQLSIDGTLSNSYSDEIYWSPDSRYISVIKTRQGSERKIPLIESAPKEQIQPILHTIDYYKPGDVLPISIPKLFEVKSGKEVAFDTKPYENQFALKFTGWRKDSKSFTFEFNQRGHQKYQVVSVTTEGECQPIIDELSSTFIYYAKNFRYYTSDDQEIIWISERDGWKHLYLFNARDGKLKNQITKGEFIVRDVVYVDEASRSILFKASGVIEGEDPYNVHLCKVNFDGSGFQNLTPEKANHKVYLSENHKYFVDVYSRPDLEPVSQLKDIEGQLVSVLEEANIDELIKDGWTRPQVFSAKGRDGKTDIWGTIHFPSNYDDSKEYPVVECIYAGPHDSHVQKHFIPYLWGVSRLCDLGFIVVRIDGMGTYNRSKAFHDVCWRNIKDAGFPDRIAWMKAAAKEYPSMDISKVGIYGWSAGGQNAMGALLFHNDFYKVAVSLCGCHDNRVDKIWWNEQWMGYPIGEWYAESSNVVNAHKLKGNLLLVNGELDKNVDPASTLQVVDALIKANKKFDMYYLPGYGHGIGNKFGMRIIHDYFVENIKGCRVPDWNE
jgi:dipeptidyl aminopeptidase/acylaminoacyl peptidase